MKSRRSFLQFLLATFGLSKAKPSESRDAKWADTFNSIPTSERLRANLNLSDAIDNALRRKQQEIVRQ